MKGDTCNGRKEFLDQLIDLMDTESDVSMDAVLNDIEERDSLSKVAFMAMAASVSEKKVSYEVVKKAATIKDLHGLIVGAEM